MNPPDTLSSTDPTTSESSSGLRSTAEKAKHATTRAMGQAKEKATHAAAERKGVAADKISGYSSALRDSARAAEEQQDDNIAYFANSAADKLEEVANYFRNSDLSRIQQDAASLARRHPTLFLGGMLVAGLVIGNLAKASVQSLHDDGFDSHDDYDNGLTEPYDDGTDAPQDYSTEATDDTFASKRGPNPESLGEPQI